MNKLVKEAHILLLPSLIMEVGLNAAIFLQQLHVNLLISTNVQHGHKWVYKTVEQWENDEFPFWSIDTIKRTIHKLEKSGYIISTTSHNFSKMDKTKSYRIHYPKLQCRTVQHATSVTAKSTQEEV
ncbi:hypothetical protein [Sporosarcina beigongshangi]|uniref:hypothetical protein n=1 Tax=Sporosarcina beigongshangi TaxID=2782538 RepID=UPI00193ADADC|nr:hypothetical protein [Sporosarcina beigongshangi]